MSRREDIDNVIWSDPDFAELTPQAKLLYLWSFTNPRCGMAGLYKVSKAAMHMECLLPMEQIDAAMQELESERFAFYDGRVMWVRSRVKHLRTRTPNIAKSIRDDLERVGVNHPHVQAFVAEYAHLGWLQLEALEDLHRPPAEVRQSVDRGSAEGHARVEGTSPDVPGQGKGKGTRGGGAGGGERQPSRRVDQDALPDDLDERLQPVAERTLSSLTKLWQQRGGAKPTRRGVGLAVKAYQDRDIARVVGELEHWSLAGHGAGRPVKDWTQTLRTFLDRSPVGSPARLHAVGPERQADLTAKLVGS